MDDYPVLEIFLGTLWVFLWVVWMFMLIRIVMDIFRDNDLGGWGKAGWLVFCIVLPYLGVLAYVITRGRSMGERDVKQAQQREAAFQEYVRQAAGTSQSSGTDELARLAQLHDSGALSDEEFQQAKSKLLHDPRPASV